MSNALSEKEKGNKLLQEGDAEGAVECFQRGVSLAGPGETELRGVLLSNLSAAHAMLNQWQEALEAARGAVESRPTWAKAHSREALALFHLNRFEAAKRAYEKCVELDPQFSGAQDALAMCDQRIKAAEFNVLGEERLNKGKFGHAAEFFEKAVAADPGSRLYHSNLSTALCSLGRYNKAMDHANQCIYLAPTWHKGWQRKAEILSSQRNYEESTPVYAHAVTLAPGNTALTRAFNHSRQELEHSRLRAAHEAAQKRDATADGDAAPAPAAADQNNDATAPPAAGAADNDAASTAAGGGEKRPSDEPLRMNSKKR